MVMKDKAASTLRRDTLPTVAPQIMVLLLTSEAVQPYEYNRLEPWQQWMRLGQSQPRRAWIGLRPLTALDSVWAEGALLESCKLKRGRWPLRIDTLCLGAKARVIEIVGPAAALWGG